MTENIFGLLDENDAQEGREKGQIRLSVRLLAVLAYLYMLLPIIFFCLFWIKIYFAIPVCVAVLAGLFFLLRREYAVRTYVVLPIKSTAFIFCALAVFLWLTGNGGFFFQYSDNHWRNALFFDMVDYDWPLIYPQTGNGVSYYLLHWIIPAMVGKVFHSTLVARVALYVWTLIGLYLVYLLLVRALRAYSPRRAWCVFGVFFAWSGLNIIGGIISNVFGLIDFDLNTYGWWTNFVLDGQGYAYMFRSNCDQLASTYNQTIAPWLAVALFADKPKISTFAFLGICVFAYSPVPFVGFFAIAVFCFIVKLMSSERKAVFREALSLPNILAVVGIAPVFISYYLCNTSAVSGANGSMFDLYIPLKNFNVYSLLILLLFYILQFGAFAFFIYKDYKKDKLFKYILICMCVIPLIKFGTMGDFCWNASVPAYFMLMMYTLDYIFKNVKIMEDGTCLKVKKGIIGLVMCFTLAVLNPVSQIAFGFKIAYQEKTLDLMCRGVVDTFSNKQIGDVLYLGNFLVPNPNDTFFFKYIAKGE